MRHVDELPVRGIFRLSILTSSSQGVVVRLPLPMRSGAGWLAIAGRVVSRRIV